MKLRVTIALLLLSAGCNSPKPEAKPEAAKAPPAPVYFTPDRATAASLSGSVTFVGKKPPAKAISMDAEEACEKLHPKPVRLSPVRTGSGGALADVFVYVKSGLEGKAFAPSQTAVVLDQKDCMFVPRVVALRAGQTLAVKNSDPVSHNIHPMPVNNREWNQQQSPGAPNLERRFSRPEIMIPVKCNVHAWMRSYIGVLEHPYFAVTSTDGRFEWNNLPPGEYVIAAWHETLGELTSKVMVEKSAHPTIRFAFRDVPQAK